MPYTYSHICFFPPPNSLVTVITSLKGLFTSIQQ